MHLPERDDPCGEVVECEEAALKFLVSHQQLAEAVEPAVADLNNPTSSLLDWPGESGCLKFC